MTKQETLAGYWADWLLDAVGTATQNRALLRDDPAEDAVLTEAILLNGKQAILNAMQPAAARIGALEKALREMVAMYEGEYDADVPFKRPDWLIAALASEQGK